MSSSEIDRLFDAALEQAEEGEKASLLSIKKGKDDLSLPDKLIGETEDEIPEEETSNLAALINDMKIPEKVKLALFGNKVARNLLIRDSNRQIPEFVLQNARITDGEILEFAKNSNLNDQILRVITKNSTWMKSYAVKLAIVTNPKVSIDVSLRWIKYLKDRDLRRLSRSKNIPQVVASQCRKLLDKRAKKPS